MILGEVKGFRRETSHINGWFAATDLVLFWALLEEQTGSGIEGDILEIGVFEGKSAVALARSLQPQGVLHVCDIFDGPSDERNMEENAMAYPGLNQKIFDGNMHKLALPVPVVHACDSAELPSRLAGHKFRFIHVDGSHLYENVARDLAYASTSVISNGGVIAVDDFRMPHTVGVAVAVWEKVLNAELHPIAMTADKIYLASPGSALDLSHVTRELEKLHIRYIYEEFRGFSVLRIPPTNDSDIYGRPKMKVKIRSFVPPIVLELRQNYLGRRRR